MSEPTKEEAEATKQRMRSALNVLQNYVNKDGRIDATKLTRDNERMRAALEAVRAWDVEHAFDGLTAGDGARFTLPHDLRKQVQDALKA